MKSALIGRVRIQRTFKNQNIRKWNSFRETKTNKSFVWFQRWRVSCFKVFLYFACSTSRVQLNFYKDVKEFLECLLTKDWKIRNFDFSDIGSFFGDVLRNNQSWKMMRTKLNLYLLTRDISSPLSFDRSAWNTFLRGDGGVTQTRENYCNELIP